MIASMGQRLVLLTAGLALSVGSTVALVSVITALVISGSPVALAIAAVGTAGLATGAVVGALNGFGVTALRVNPFRMTLGMLSVALGIALTVSGGSPIDGMPEELGTAFAYAEILGLPVPMYFTAGIFISVCVYLNWTRTGRYVYALASNVRAAELSGIRTKLHTFIAYVLCGLLTAGGGVLMAARVSTGEANIGQDMVLQFHNATGERHEPRRCPELFAAGRAVDLTGFRDLYRSAPSSLSRESRDGLNPTCLA